MQTISLQPHTQVMLTHLANQEVDLIKRDIILLEHLGGATKQLVINIAKLLEVDANMLPPNVRAKNNFVRTLGIELVRKIIVKINEDVELEKFIPAEDFVQARALRVKLSHIRGEINDETTQLDERAMELVNYLTKIDRLPAHKALIQDLRNSIRTIMDSNKEDFVLSGEISHLADSISAYEAQARRQAAALRRGMMAAPQLPRPQLHWAPPRIKRRLKS